MDTLSADTPRIAPSHSSDDLSWLRPKNWEAILKDPQELSKPLRHFLERENKNTQEALRPIEELYQTLLYEMQGRVSDYETSAMRPLGEYFYGYRYEPAKEHPLFVRKKRSSSQEELLLDANALAKRINAPGGFRVGCVKPSPDNRYIAYSFDVEGSGFYTIEVLDTKTKKRLDVSLSGAQEEIAWNKEGGFFYATLTPSQHPYEVRYHRLQECCEEGSQEDIVLFVNEDTSRFIHLYKTQNEKFLILDLCDHATGEIYALPLGASMEHARFIRVFEAQEGVEYVVEHDAAHERFLVLTNANGAEDFSILSFEDNEFLSGKASFDAGSLFVPHQSGHFIEEQHIYRTHHVRLVRENTNTHIILINLTTRAEERVILDFAEEAYKISLIESLEFDTETLLFSYESLATPPCVYSYNFAERTFEKIWEKPVVNLSNPFEYKLKRCFVKARDGEDIPLTLFYRRDLFEQQKVDGKALPCVLYGYGSYGMSVEASFNTSLFSLVDRGIVYAIAHVRGGCEKGRAWYEAGKKHHKLNTFYDFIDVAQYLVDKHITSPQRLVAYGGSAGGMLMGVIANWAPELFLGIVALVPFVDVLETMCDASLPLTPPEWSEWGNPIEDSEAHHLISSYSPIDQIKHQPYPHIFALTGLCDASVGFWEPAKWIVKLRAFQTNNPLTLLQTQMDAGHQGSTGRLDAFEERARIQSFMLGLLEGALS